MEHITIPLLENLAKELSRPGITTPDLIELNSGYWDLRRYTEGPSCRCLPPFHLSPNPIRLIQRISPPKDGPPVPTPKILKFLTRPSPPPAKPHGKSKLEKQSNEQRSPLQGKMETQRLVHHCFGELYMRHLPGIIMHLSQYALGVAFFTQAHPDELIYLQRVSSLDALSMKVVADLSSSNHKGFTEDLGLDERLRVNNAGHLLRGQEHHFRDLLHPAMIPGSYLWGDVMLYELKRAVMAVGRSSDERSTSGPFKLTPPSPSPTPFPLIPSESVSKPLFLSRKSRRPLKAAGTSAAQTLRTTFASPSRPLLSPA
ncbi:hypothetical protein P7C70_g3134, partial [Phenoliferia sp. Uapishka_3]